MRLQPNSCNPSSLKCFYTICWVKWLQDAITVLCYCVCRVHIQTQGSKSTTLYYYGNFYYYDNEDIKENITNHRSSCKMRKMRKVNYPWHPQCGHLYSWLSSLNLSKAKRQNGKCSFGMKNKTLSLFPDAVQGGTGWWTTRRRAKKSTRARVHGMQNLQSTSRHTRWLDPGLRN